MQRCLTLMFAVHCSLLALPAQGQWSSLGPAPTTGFSGAAGRTSAIIASPTDPGRHFVAGADGGVWRTTDGGQTWQPLTDHLPTPIGALAFDPTDESIIYAGSGEANFANHSRHGAGIYKSADGGDTWTVLGADTFGGRCISRIIVDHLNPQVLYASVTQAGGFPQKAAAKNHPLADGPRGVFRSSDGGETWSRITTLPDLCATDMAMDPQNSSVLYAAFGHIFGDAANGIYKSIDAGVSWSKLTSGLGTSTVGRISIAVAPSQPARLYALVTNPSTSSGGSATTIGIYMSSNAGATWSLLSISNLQATYGWYLSTVHVHPGDPETAFFGGLTLRRRNASGGFSTVTPPHVDLHGLAFDASGRLLAACDGGVYRSPDNGASWVSLNAGLSTIQFYAGLSTSPATPEYLIGGTQDNGTNRRTTASQTWAHVQGGDGGWTQVNSQNPQIVFCESQGTGALYRSSNGGASFSGSGSGISGRNCFLPPYLIDHANPSRILYATERIFQSLDGGLSWSALSPDLTAGAPAAIRALAMAPTDPAYVYAATNDGRVLSSMDGGVSFSLRLTDVGTYPRVTRELAVDPLDPLTVYHAGWTYGPAPRLRRSRDGGETWEALDAALPDIPINVVAIDPRWPQPTIYVGADDGVYRSVNDGLSWRRFAEPFPRTAVIDLILEPDRDRLTAGTQGRGAWRVQIEFCYADIDDDGQLTVADFGAFLQAFAAQKAQANCDGSTAMPKLSIADFGCFLQKFAAGCP